MLSSPSPLHKTPRTDLLASGYVRKISAQIHYGPNQINILRREHKGSQGVHKTHFFWNVNLFWFSPTQDASHHPDHIKYVERLEPVEIYLVSSTFSM